MTLTQRIQSIPPTSCFATGLILCAGTDLAGCIEAIKMQSVDNYEMTARIVGKQLLVDVLNYEV